jgi:sulfur carrier protein
MKLILNNRPETIDGHQQLSVAQLIELKNFTYKMLIVKVNETTIHRNDYETTLIKEGDRVAVVHLMTGG